MRAEVAGKQVAFTSAEGRAGVYHLDEHKPFLHPLLTPAGHCLTSATPHDHLHHKGLMFSLQTPEASWWDEVPHPDSERVGRQRTVSIEGAAHGEGYEAVDHALVWEAEDGSVPTFEEHRTVGCREVEDGYEWLWISRLRALRDCTLTQALHSLELPDGERVNYQGLSLRLARDFIQGSRLFVDSERVAFVDASGREPLSVRVEGRLDPEYPSWPGPRVSIDLYCDGSEAHRNGLFALGAPFTYLAVGPSNLAPLALVGGQLLALRYTVFVRDLPDA